ncbi:MAG: hypothetical protein QW650_06670 [Thermofilum sp.]
MEKSSCGCRISRLGLAMYNISRNSYKRLNRCRGVASTAMPAPLSRRSSQITLLAIFSALAFIASLIVAATASFGAIVYAVVLLTGALTVSRPFSATAIAAASGLFYSLVSPSPLMLGTFLIRGLVLDLIFIPTRVYERSAKGEYNIPLIVAAMVASGLSAGLYVYFFLALFLNVMPSFTPLIAAAIFLASAASNAVVGYVIPKYVMPRLRKV